MDLTKHPSGALENALEELPMEVPLNGTLQSTQEEFDVHPKEASLNGDSQSIQEELPKEAFLNGAS